MTLRCYQAGIFLGRAKRSKRRAAEPISKLVAFIQIKFFAADVPQNGYVGGKLTKNCVVFDIFFEKCLVETDFIVYLQRQFNYYYLNIRIKWT